MMTIRQNHMQDPSTMSSATLIKHSNSLLKLSTKSIPCVCDIASKTQSNGFVITGWGRVSDGGGHKTSDGKGGGGLPRLPRKPFPSRLYEMTSYDSRPIDYVFRHYTDTASYMEQYRRHHTVMDTGRTLQQAPAEVFVTLRHEVKGALPVKGLPLVRGKRSVVLSKTTARSDHSQDVDNGCKTQYCSSLSASQKLITAVDRKLDSKMDTVATARYKMADASTGGSFLNIIGEFRPEAVRGKLGRASRNSAGTGSSVSQSESNHWRSSCSLRHNSAGIAPSGDARMTPQSFGKQPISYLGQDNVTRKNTWDELWRENFLNFRSSTAEVANKNDIATNARGRHRPRGRVNHATALLCAKKDKDRDFTKSPKNKKYSQNDVSSDQDSDSEQITSSDYLGTRSLFQTTSVGHLNSRNIAARPPINFGLQRRAPPLSRDTVVVGSTCRTEIHYSTFK